MLTRPIADSRLVAQVSCGKAHTMLLQTDGHVRSWGLNDDGQLGNGSTKDADEPQVCQLGTATAIQVACGGMHSLVLVKGGSVYGCGTATQRCHADTACLGSVLSSGSSLSNPYRCCVQARIGAGSSGSTPPPESMPSPPGPREPPRSCFDHLG